MSADETRVRDETVQVWDGRLKLHVKVAGDGPPLLFFHPLPGLAWHPMLDQLARRHTVYAPEHPGTSPGDPQAIAQVQTFLELMLVYDEAIRALGVRHCIAQCAELLEVGVPGLHFYTFNRARAPIEILAALRGQQLLAS